MSGSDGDELGGRADARTAPSIALTDVWPARSYDGGDFTVMVVGGPNSRNGASSSPPRAPSFLPS